MIFCWYNQGWERWLVVATLSLSLSLSNENKKYSTCARLRKCLRFLASYALFTGPASTESSKYNFKIRSHSTIYTFKNYFATMFLAISGIQTDLICLFGNSLFSWNWKFFVESIIDKTKKVTEIVQWDSWIVTKIIIRPINSSKNKLNRKKKRLFNLC